MPFQYTWELDLSGQGTVLPVLFKQETVGPGLQYLFDLSPHYYIPSIDITIASGLNGYYDYTITGTVTPIGVSVYFPNNSEVTWSIGLYSDVTITGMRVYMDKYGDLLTANHGGSGWEFFSFDPLRTNYRDIWVIYSLPQVSPAVVFRSANKYHVTASGKYDGVPFIPVVASGNTLTNIVCMNNIIPSDWSIYHPYFFDYYREPTILDTDGSLTVDFNIYPHYERVYGGSPTCSGSHEVDWLWQGVLDNASGTLGLSSYTNHARDFSLQTKTIGDSLGINPNKIRYGLLAWHPFQESGPLYYDRSGYGIHASGTGPMSHIIGKYGYGVGLNSYPYNHLNVPITQQSQDYMISFWFKPTALLTSGIDNNFVIMESDAFYGDHFKDSHDYLVYTSFKGWELLGLNTVTCSAGFENDYLRLKGNSFTDWFGVHWNASTLYFDIPKSRDWDVETKFRVVGDLESGQAAGFLFFNQASYFDYCSLIIQGDTPDETEYQFVESTIPYMTAEDEPYPYIVSESSYYLNNVYYKGWRALENAYGSQLFLSGNGSLPEWLKLDTGGPRKVIQGYRLRDRGGHFPRDWQFQGSNNDTEWTTLHTMVNQPAPGDGNWTSWFYFSNETTYRYYRFYVTDSESGTYCSWDGTEFFVKDKVALNIDANIKVQTRDLSYTVESHASISGTWIFEMHKRGDYVWFGYREDTDDTMGFITPINRMDVSLWGEEMRLGVQSRNPIGNSPEVLFDYFRFRRGVMPEGVGDPEEPGRFKITYNQADSGDIVEDRTDSRLWLMTSRSGIAYGTSRYKWEPNQWYLVQAGVRPGALPSNMNEDFCWWVNVKQENGEVVGSGIGPDVFVVSGDGINYFDPEPYTTSSGSFQLDEVSHWNRWLNAEDILKMWNKVSQISWHNTIDYLETDEDLLSVETTQSGYETFRTVPNTREFEWFTYYQAPQVSQQSVQMEKISYRIQKDIKVAAWQIEPKEISILRMSSGWISQNNNCYCLEDFFEDDEYQRPIDASADKVYSAELPMDLFDGDENTYYRSGVGPPVNIMFTYESEVGWASFRMRAFNSSTYWDDDFPKDIEIYGSNKDSPNLLNNDDWEYQFQVSCSLPSGNHQWCSWVEFPNVIVFKHFKLKILNNTYNTSNWISVSEMEIKTGNYQPTIYGLMEVRGDIAIYTRAFDYPIFDVLEITIPRTNTNYSSLEIYDPNSLGSHYVIPQIDTVAPYFSYLNPTRNSRFVHPEFLWFPLPKAIWQVSDIGNGIVEHKNKIWMSMPSGHPSEIYDHFNFYSFDYMSAVPSGGLVEGPRGWKALNTQSSGIRSFYTNQGFDVTVSGENFNQTVDSIEDAQEVLKYTTYADPSVRVSIDGTKSLVIDNIGEPKWELDNHTAPFMYWDVASGINSWEFIAKLSTDFGGSKKGQRAGVMLVADDDPNDYYHCAVTCSGIVIVHSTQIDEPYEIFVDKISSDPIWVKLKREQQDLTFHYSLDNVSWKDIPVVYGEPIKLSPTMSGYENPAPYKVFEHSHVGDYYGWKAFDGILSFNGEGLEQLLPGYSVDRWQVEATSSDPLPKWLTLDFGQSIFITHFRLFAPNLHYEVPRIMPRDVEIWGSDDNINWSVLTEHTVQNARRAIWHPLVEIERPGYFRYYRLEMKTMQRQSLYGTFDSGGWDPYVEELEYWGPISSGIQVRSGVDFKVGLTVTADCYRPVTVLEEGTFLLHPYPMTSNTEPAPYIVSGDPSSSNNYKVFTYEGISISAGGWVAIELPESMVATGFRFWSSWLSFSYNCYFGFYFEGSNDYNNWVSLFETGEQSYRARSWLYPQGDSLFIVNNKKRFKYYRLRMESNNYHDYGSTSGPVHVEGLNIFGHGENLESEKFHYSDVVASFEQVKFVASPMPEYMCDRGDPWQLILDGDQVVNSTVFNGITSYSKLDDNLVQLDYEIKTNRSFLNGEQVFLRAEFYDEPSFNISYNRYEIGENILCYLKGNGEEKAMVDSRVSPYEPIDSSVYNRQIFTSIDYPVTFSGSGYAGETSLCFNASSYLEFSVSGSDLISDDFSVHCWLKYLGSGGMDFQLIGNPALSVVIRPTDLELTSVLTSGSYYITGNFLTTLYDTDWHHVALVRHKENIVRLFIDGYRYDECFIPTDISTTSGSSGVTIGPGFNGLVAHWVLEKGIKWRSSPCTANSIDEILTFKIADWQDFEVVINPVPDEKPPACVPVSPLPNASGVCPASGIQFDILDDYSGVNWDNLIINIDGITVWSGGNNMTDWYEDRGTLVYEDRGRRDGEWEYDFPQGTSGTVIRVDGLNRQLYPPGTVYSGSGAWGRRFTYYVDNDTQIEYFDYRMTITITGTDNRGYLSQFDDIEINSFNYEYGFDFITNNNIRMDNFFLGVGESERIDILQAQGRHLWVDVWDTDYPSTDIVEDDSYLRFYDGVLDFVCSGIWWTTYTGTEGTTSGIKIHRLHYDAGDYYWDGHRTMHWELHAQNNNPRCGVYNRNEYQLLYGWHLFWLHHERIPPFDFNQQLPVFVSIKTQDYLPSRYSKSYMLWTAPAQTHDFNVAIKALPLGAGNELEVDILAHSHYLQYSEDVDVELYCKDRDGNELLYTWTFTTEDEP